MQRDGELNRPDPTSKVNALVWARACLAVAADAGAPCGDRFGDRRVLTMVYAYEIEVAVR